MPRNARERGSKHAGQTHAAKPLANIMTRLRAGGYDLFVTHPTRVQQPSDLLRSEPADEHDNPTQKQNEYVQDFNQDSSPPIRRLLADVDGGHGQRTDISTTG